MPKKAAVAEEPIGDIKTLVWNDTGICECPGCGATVIVGIMSLCATCKTCGLFYADVPGHRGWYFSRISYARGAPKIPCPWVLGE